MYPNRKPFLKVFYCFIGCLFSVNISFSQKAVPYQDDFFVIKNFKFSDGSFLDSLKLHYYFVGTPHLNKQGNIDKFFYKKTESDRYFAIPINPIIGPIIFARSSTK